MPETGKTIVKLRELAATANGYNKLVLCRPELLDDAADLLEAGLSRERRAREETKRS